MSPYGPRGGKRLVAAGMGRGMRTGLGAAMLAVLCALAFGPAARAQPASRCQPGADALGVERTLTLTTTGGPRYGNNRPADHGLLHDHEVVLTFDDGPHPVYTRLILEALAAHCTKAAFFMLGLHAIKQKDLVREIAERGHTIASHTWSHPNLAKIDFTQARGEIELGISSVQWALGTAAAPFFRLPYLSGSPAVLAYLKSRNTGVFYIDVDSNDYRTRSPTAVIHNVLTQLDARRKGIILFHDIQPSTASALKPLLGELKRRGYKVVHLRPAQGQVTVAEYDKRMLHDYADRQLAVRTAPVRHRAATARAWDVSIAPDARTGRSGEAAASLRMGGGDWRTRLFRGW